MESVENILKKPVNILVCFTDPKIGRVLSRMAVYFANFRLEKSSVTFLHLTENNNHEDQTQLNDFMDIIDKNNITIRYFSRKNDDYIAEILKTSKEQNSDLILVGIGNNVLTPQIYQKYNRLKSDPTNSDAYIMEQFTKEESVLLNNISSLFDVNTINTGLFICNDLKHIKKIFAPILCMTDIQMVSLTTIRLAQKDNIELMIWDAIGAIELNPKMQKLQQSFVKKIDEKINIWNNDEKIDTDFIIKQDLCIFGLDGWNKLISTPLSWINQLPSTLIIKDNII